MRAAAFVALSAAAVGGSNVTAEFRDFAQRFGKAYATASEEAYRAVVFSANLNRVAKLNAAEAAAGQKYPPYGVTSFSDLTPDEFRASHLGGYTRRAPAAAAEETAVQPNATRRAMAREQAVGWGVKANSSSPLTTHSYCPGSHCSPMQNQGSCGDCWAFSSTEILETQTAIGGRGLTRLSPQELADCLTSACNGGGAGGDTPLGWNFAKNNGIQTLANYPITSSGSGRLGKCRKNRVSSGHVSSYSSAGRGSESTMASTVQQHGPVSVAVDAHNWQFYDGGRMSRAQAGGNPGCSVITSATCGRDKDHSVGIFGWQGTSTTTVTNWVVRNHWGTGWGCGLSSGDSAGDVGGYAFVEAGTNACGIATQVFMVTP